jgi:hypothetical protein
MNLRCITRSITLAMAVVLPSVGYSQQSANKVFAALTTDSTAWQRVLVYTIGALSSQLVTSATDPTPQPWRLTLPSDDQQQDLIRTQLRTILRMRQPMPADTLVRTLEFGSLVISGDTARVKVRYEEIRKCPGTSRTTGSGWSSTVLVPREPRQKFWGSARARTATVGDRVSC